MRRFLNHLAAIVCWLGLTSNALCLDPLKTYSQFSLDIWQDKDGLPQTSVEAIVQTRDGYLWFGTQSGLARFDGVKFTVFRDDRARDLEGHYIRVLFEASDGTLWIGFDGAGASQFRDGKFTNFQTRDGLGSNHIRAIHEDKKGQVWIGCSGGLSRFQDGKFTTFRLPAPSNVYHLHEEPDGTLLVGTDNGVFSFDGIRFRPIFAGLLANPHVRALFRDSEDQLWIGTIGGLHCYTAGRMQLFTTQEGLPNNHIRRLLQDRDGTFWIATWGGLSRYRNGRFDNFTTLHGLSDDFVYSVLEDREGNLWIGTRGGGVNRLKEGKFASYTNQEGLSSNFTISVLNDKQGAIWIGTDSGGLNRLQGGTLTKFENTNGLNFAYSAALCQSQSGAVFIGTLNQGVVRYKDGHFTDHTPGPWRALNINPKAILEDTEGSLWIGTGGRGLGKLRGDTFTAYTTADGLTSDYISALYQDRSGHLWIGADGLNKFQDGRFAAVPNGNGTAIGVVTAFHEDEDNVLWIGTRSSGLFRIKDKQLRGYSTKDGLLYDMVYHILEDENNNLWISSSKGIWRLNRLDVDAYDQKLISSIPCVGYGVPDGMKSSSCEGIGEPAGCKTKDGRLWFTTIKGLAVIDPSNIKTNTLPPPVLIEKIVINREERQSKDLIRLHAGAREIEFHYTALSYTAPENVRFKYKLEEFDQEWIDAGNRRTAYYGNLPGGEYRFRVIACNNDGVWNTAGAAISVLQLPHFYQTGWFYVSCACLVGLAVFAWHRAHLLRVRTQFSTVLNERMRIARDLHDTLEQGLVGISMQLDVVSATLNHAPKTAKQALDVASHMVKHSMAEARRSIMDLRPDALERGDLVTALAEIGKELTNGTEVRFKSLLIGDVQPLPKESETQLLRIGQEAITNSLKHGKPTDIEVRWSFTDKEVILQVRDNGRGFAYSGDQTLKNGHFGLRGMRERANAVGGTLKINSSPGCGTQVEISVPRSEMSQ